VYEAVLHAGARVAELAVVQLSAVALHPTLYAKGEELSEQLGIKET